MTPKRGMNMRDMKSRSMGKTAPSPAPQPNTGRKGLERGLQARRCKAPDTAPPRDREGEGDEPELLDEMNEAVHMAQNDGHFAPTKRFVRDDEDDRECPDEAPPGWCGDD